MIRYISAANFKLKYNILPINFDNLICKFTTLYCLCTLCNNINRIVSVYIRGIILVIQKINNVITYEYFYFERRHTNGGYINLIKFIIHTFVICITFDVF